MKPGDLVTLSARGCKLISLKTWSKEVREGKVVGLLKRVEKSRYDNRYHVQWIGNNGPEHGRDRWINFFYRTDLKIVSRAK